MQILNVSPTVIWTFLVSNVFSAAVSSMPAPKDNSSAWYQFVYKFANAVFANVSAIRGKAQYQDTPAPKQESEVKAPAPS